jgi:hypothetical protein
VPVRLLLLTLAFAHANQGQAQQASNGGIRGIVVDRSDHPVAHARIEVRRQNGSTIQSAATAPDGSYSIGELPADTYIIGIFAGLFFSTEIRDVRIEGQGVKTLPAVSLQFEGIANCSVDARPKFYRLVAGTPEKGGVGGVVTNEEGEPVAGATVTLYAQGKGPVVSQATRTDGTFSFAGLQRRSEEYWVSIKREDYFPEEVRHLDVSPGLEAVYVPIAMELCSPGRCDPSLKRIQIIGPCA